MAFLASVPLSLLLTSIQNFAVKEVCQILGVDKEMRILERTVFKIQAIIEKVELGLASFPTVNAKKLWDGWLDEVQGFTYDVDDLFESISLILSQPPPIDDTLLQSTGDKTPHVRDKCPSVRDTLLSKLRIDVVRDIGAKSKKLKDLATEMESFLKNHSTKSNILMGLGNSSYYPKSTCSVVDESIIKGREEEESELIKNILSSSDPSSLSVITITGMGGIGKTTLAQMIFNHRDIVKCFPLRIWISVPVHFDIHKILQSMIEVITRKNCKLIELESLQYQLQQLLSLEKFLLVLDGVWFEKHDDWEKLFLFLKSGAKKGGNVIITSRSEKVSCLGGTKSVHLTTLSGNECWKIMKQGLSNNLEHVGLELADKVQGLPLAAKMLGACLRFTLAEEWESILRSKLCNLPDYERVVFPSLAFSYYSLPPVLKKCFAYCSLFPRGYQFDMDHMILLWLAEGLIQPIGGRRLEDIGREYFKELLSRSLFDSSASNHDVYVMHAFNQNMAERISSGICHQMENNTSYPLLEGFRHLSVRCSHDFFIDLKKFPKCDKLRTFLLFCESGMVIDRQISPILEKFSVIRVLDLTSGGIKELPVSIGNLKYLRYLSLADNPISKLPEEVASLSCLQTLVLTSCPLLVVLPKKFSKLTNLRHLKYDVKQKLSQMPRKFGKLVNLQTLDAFVVGKDEGYGIDELQNMRCLRGPLCITHLENVLNEDKSMRASLKLKPFIDKLLLEWTVEVKKGVSNHCKTEILESLDPHNNLKELIITAYSGFTPPLWLSDKQKNLKVLTLQGFRNCYRLPSLGNLPFLEYLVIEGMTAVDKVEPEFSGLADHVGFPSLKKLEVANMPILTGWKCLDMPRLCDLKFEGCPVLKQLADRGLPASVQTVTILNCHLLTKKFQVDGEYWWKVKSVPKCVINGQSIPTVPLRA